VWLGARVWEWPGAGRFYRSIIGRYIARLGESEARFRSVRVGDAAFVADVTEFTTLTLYFGNRPYEPATTDYLLRTLRPGHVFVDIGANHGYFTLIASAIVGHSGRVIAFEPNPNVFVQLVAHVNANHFDDRTDLLEQALSNRARDRVTLYVSECRTNSGLSTLVPDAERFAVGSVSHENTVEVRVDTFDRWLSASGLERVDVVKIDTEGCEDLVVEGMAASLQGGRVGSVICETRADSGAYRTLRAAGYLPQPLEAVGEILTNFVFTRRDQNLRGA
jgi:FkbM family methyltransferase